MAITRLDSSAWAGPSTAVRRLCYSLRICFPGILLVSCAVFGATQCYAQDAAKAARQERARKESRQKQSKHVYTEEDLKRPHILTPEDRAQIEAKRDQKAAPTAQRPQEALDAQSLPPDAPLGDVARHFQKQKESQKLQPSAEFHLPFADAPTLASPKPPVQPLRPPTSKPLPPRFAPYRPPVKRSPFDRPNIFVAAPPRVIPSHPPAVPVVPSQPVALPRVIVQRGDSLWKLAQQNLGQGLRWHELLSVNPGIRDPNYIAAGSQIYIPARSSVLRTPFKIKVQKGDTLWKIAQTRLGHATYWSCIAHANPGIRDANLIYEGQELLLPASCTP